MSEPVLGKLEKVGLKTVWETEAGGFTPWLAREENLVLLGEAIDVELELEATEKNVGPFRADILCKDTASGHWVLIESRISITRQDTDIKKRDDWADQHRWLQRNLEAMHRVFAPRLKHMDVNELEYPGHVENAEES